LSGDLGDNICEDVDAIIESDYTWTTIQGWLKPQVLKVRGVFCAVTAVLNAMPISREKQGF